MLDFAGSIVFPDESPVLNCFKHLESLVWIICNLSHSIAGMCLLFRTKLLSFALRHEDSIEATLSVVALESAPVDIAEEGMALDLWGSIDTEAFGRDTA